MPCVKKRKLLLCPSELGADGFCGFGFLLVCFSKAQLGKTFLNMVGEILGISQSGGAGQTMLSCGFTGVMF